MAWFITVSGRQTIKLSNYHPQEYKFSSRPVDTHPIILLDYQNTDLWYSNLNADTC